MRRVRLPPCGDALTPRWLKVWRNAHASPSQRCRRQGPRQWRYSITDGQTCSRSTSPSKACAVRPLREENQCCSRPTSFSGGRANGGRVFKWRNVVISIALVPVKKTDQVPDLHAALEGGRIDSRCKLSALVRV